MLRILADTGVVSSANFAEGAVRVQKLQWGPHSATVDLHGFRRAGLHRDAAYQAQKDALFTIGRLARDGEVELYTSSELAAETWRGDRGRDHAGNAFRGCRFLRCEVPLERSLYCWGLSWEQVITKGDRADREAGKQVSGSQVDFCKFLLHLTPDLVDQLLSLDKVFVRNDFQRESLRDVFWYQRAVRVAPSEKNLPDFFHLWTARRNRIDVFLTLETKLPRYAATLKREGLVDSFEVLRPIELLDRLGIAAPDPVPLEPDRFYSFAELMGKQFTGWKR